MRKMHDIFKRTWRWIFPNISRRAARKIVSEYVGCDYSEAHAYAKMPSNCSIYNPPAESCWYVYVPWNDGIFALRSSHVIAISKNTGKILYDGNAGDEG